LTAEKMEVVELERRKMKLNPMSMRIAGLVLEAEIILPHFTGFEVMAGAFDCM
jgi:hypothetical protein